MNQLVDKALRLAAKHHDGVYRKYGEPPPPYLTHSVRVWSMVRVVYPHDAAIQAVALLHDVPEDPDKYGRFITREEMLAEVTKDVVDGAYLLINASKDSSEPRAIRKALDRAHIKELRVGLRVIKLADRIDNLSELIQAAQKGYKGTRGFLTLYLARESALALRGPSGDARGLRGGSGRCSAGRRAILGREIAQNPTRDGKPGAAPGFFLTSSTRTVVSPQRAHAWPPPPAGRIHSYDISR